MARASSPVVMPVSRPAPPSDAEAPRAWRTAQFAGLSGLLLLLVLAKGAVEPWAQLTLEAAATLLFILWAAEQIARGEIRVPRNPLLLPMACMGLLVAVQCLFQRSAYPYVTNTEALTWLAYGLLAWVAAHCFESDEFAAAFGTIIGVFALLFALAAVTQDVTGMHLFFWIRSSADAGWGFGSYVDHDHFAGLMEMLAPICLARGLSRGQGSRSRSLYLTAGLAGAASVFLSGSRGGMIAIAVAMATLAIAIPRHRSVGRVAATLFSLGGAVALLLYAAARSLVVQRMLSLTRPGKIGDIRWPILRDAPRVILAHPLLGSGLGTFPTIYPRFRTFATNYFINAAHNDYLQTIAEMGLIGGAVMVWWIVCVYRTASRRRDGSLAARSLRIGALAGVTALLVHSFVDFNLQIPANAAMFFVIAIIATSRMTPAVEGERTAVDPASLASVEILLPEHFTKRRRPEDE